MFATYSSESERYLIIHFSAELTWNPPQGHTARKGQETDLKHLCLQHPWPPCAGCRWERDQRPLESALVKGCQFGFGAGDGTRLEACHLFPLIMELPPPTLNILYCSYAGQSWLIRDEGDRVVKETERERERETAYQLIPREHNENCASNLKARTPTPAMGEAKSSTYALLG